MCFMEIIFGLRIYGSFCIFHVRFVGFGLVDALFPVLVWAARRCIVCWFCFLFAFAFRGWLVGNHSASPSGGNQVDGLPPA